MTSVAVLAITQPAVAQTQPAASDQGGIEEIVVTAQRRSESLQSVPVSVMAITGASLATRGIEQIADLGKTTPGLDMGRASGVIQPFLRGIGNLSTALGNESSVAVYMDGVFFSRLPTAVFSLTNVERVEVLKGPQGTLFGRNSSAGVIQVVTKDPSHGAQVKGRINYGNYDIVEGDIYATVGLTDDIAVDLSVAGRKQGDGFGRNITTGNRAAFEDYYTVRGKLLWELGDRTKIRASYMRAYNKVGVEGNTWPGTFMGYESLPVASAPLPPLGYYDQRTDIDVYARADMWAGSLRVEQDLNFATLSSITAWSRVNTLNVLDQDFTERSDAVSPVRGHVSLWTQELQLSSASGGDLDWVTGLFYYNSLAAYDLITFRSPSGKALPASVQPGGLTAAVAGLDATDRQRAQSYAAYGQATYRMGDFSLTGGLRFTRDDTRARGSILLGTVTRVALGLAPLQIAGPPNSVKSDNVTYRLAAAYQFSDEVNGYASFSKGYKAGIFNLLLYSSTPAKPEKVDAYELGLKTNLFDRRLRLNGALFWMDVRNPQVQIFQNSTVIFSNAKSARSKGFEFDGVARLAEGLNFRFGAAYVDAKYRSYVNAVCAPENPNPPYGRIRPAIQCDATGNRLPRAPKLTSNLGIDYKVDIGLGELTFTVDHHHNSGYYQAASNDLQQKAYDIIDAQVRLLLANQIGLRAWGRNLLSEKYATRGVESTGPAGSPYQPAAPRTYGVGLDFSF